MSDQPAHDVRTFRLAEENRNLRGRLRRDSGPTARTLVKNGPLRATLVSLQAGGTVQEHQASGPITIHVLSGSLAFRIGEETHALTAGDLLSLGAGIRHSVDTEAGADFLVTIALSEQTGEQPRPYADIVDDTLDDSFPASDPPSWAGQ